MDMKKYAAAIRQIESSGNYSALGPVVQKGSYAGDRAYGAYQVMGKNIGPWTKEVFGRAMSKAEFLADSSAQDRVFAAKFGQSVARYGNAVDAASVWHSGRPLAKAAAAGATDGYTRTQDYAARFGRLVEGTERISARAEHGYASGINEADFTGVDPSSNSNVVQFPDARNIKNQKFAESLQQLAELRQFAAQNSRFGAGQSGPMQPIAPIMPTKIRTAQPLKSGVM
jgi:hypothetical protein